MPDKTFTDINVNKIRISNSNNNNSMNKERELVRREVDRVTVMGMTGDILGWDKKCHTSNRATNHFDCYHFGTKQPLQSLSLAILFISGWSSLETFIKCGGVLLTPPTLTYIHVRLRTSTHIHIHTCTHTHTHTHIHASMSGKIHYSAQIEGGKRKRRGDKGTSKMHSKDILDAYHFTYKYTLFRLHMEYLNKLYDD
ncbi:hypothetical protein LOAG_11187 [Loa loa]|uniref:Uncharacterized protein n=1 Tax=Loa loa TaxID=7209 RepID=A0A1S0TNY7_LOALO|nr:hypothetical protein LOAG_11187 [Loa loa]EFO17312.1 hypothetical protein LOAG_11187 [Loa loa]